MTILPHSRTAAIVRLTLIALWLTLSSACTADDTPAFSENCTVKLVGDDQMRYDKTRVCSRFTWAAR